MQIDEYAKRHGEYYIRTWMIAFLAVVLLIVGLQTYYSFRVRFNDTIARYESMQSEVDEVLGR